MIFKLNTEDLNVLLKLVLEFFFFFLNEGLLIYCSAWSNPTYIRIKTLIKNAHFLRMIFIFLEKFLNIKIFLIYALRGIISSLVHGESV